MALVKVKMLTPMYGPERRLNPGDEAEFEKVDAERMAARGMVEILEGKKSASKKTTKKKRTANRKPSETADEK